MVSLVGFTWKLKQNKISSVIAGACEEFKVEWHKKTPYLIAIFIPFFWSGDSFKARNELSEPFIDK